eukprot:TRINITY_DN75606_c0_g1_i1.p1 TRINITY_DN75606_c0_g1~~TRINITY_DN75606_c0_g1_i1.p1  ORF type:complete len:555 (+),score=74.54 TRINITY_DN75606_c0_g1_i1:135-1799(+)
MVCAFAGTGNHGGADDANGGGACSQGLSSTQVAQVEDTDAYRLPTIPEGSHFARMVGGVGVGDPVFDVLEGRQLRHAASLIGKDTRQRSGSWLEASDVAGSKEEASCGEATTTAAPTSTEIGSDLLSTMASLPTWADPDRMRRGQAVYKQNCLFFTLAYKVALLWGCRIDRFAAVLVRSGYTASPLIAFRRFRETARHVITWCSDPAFPACGDGQTESAALLSIIQVRAAHALARRHVAASGACTVGVPVSQFDLAFTLMAFSLIALDNVINDLGQHITREEAGDYLHLWRVIGHFHGILDEFNPCRDFDDAVEILKDSQELFFFGSYALGGKPAARKLTLTVFEGFGTYTSGPDILGATFLQPLRTKPFLPMKAIDWLPFGSAYAGVPGQETAHRRLQVACYLFNGVLERIAQWPRLRRFVNMRYYNGLQNRLVKRSMPQERMEAFLRVASSATQAFVACLARLCGLLGLVPDDGPVREVSEEERRALFVKWRSNFDGFAQRGRPSPSFGARSLGLVAKCRAVSMVIFLVAVSKWLLRRRGTILRRLSTTHPI